MTILCLASYEKGHEFLRECKRQGWSVVLVTAESIRHTAQWPMEAIDEIFYLPDEGRQWNPAHMRNAVSYLARTRVFDRIVAAGRLRRRTGRHDPRASPHPRHGRDHGPLLSATSSPCACGPPKPGSMCPTSSTC